MITNLSPLDRALRMVVGVVLLATPTMSLDVPFFWLGIIPIATAVIGWCPLYRLFGASSVREGSYRYREDVQIGHKASAGNTTAHAH